MIISCCQDLLWTSRISAAARALGLSCVASPHAQAVKERLSQPDQHNADAVTGLAIDLEGWPEALDLIAWVKEHHAQVKVAAFGSHVARQTLQAARGHGADFVFPRSAWSANLPAILQRLAADEPAESAPPPPPSSA